MKYEALVNAAREAMENAHAPYSKFMVGAAIMLDSCDIVSGCNIENASYGATVCAERVAIFKAVSEAPGAEITALAVVTSSNPPAPPCALCLQVISEFCSPDLPIILESTSGERKEYTFKELLPHPFTDF